MRDQGTTGLLVRMLGGPDGYSSNQDGGGWWGWKSSQERSAASVMKEAKRLCLEQKKAKTG